jgi:hypothetical protein
MNDIAAGVEDVSEALLTSWMSVKQELTWIQGVEMCGKFNKLLK